ncbi:unnamed protein product [Paramecium octaurelia]|uniref:Uncharacterized protein n=1 Tax=Paramecium octaurelia TaxID=43137 RepID=A0A8S1RZ00_PAROT|nr:unnamed protein product [Paramecium octaurelia]
MYENDNTDTADSHYKNEELIEELQKYWRLVINHMGSDYQHLLKLSSDSDALELVQSLMILEDIRYNDQKVPQNHDLENEIMLFRQQITNQKNELESKTKLINELLQKQTQLQEQNQEMLLQLIKKEEENSSKIAQLQKEMKINNRIQHRIPSQLSSARLPNQQYSQSLKSSPQPREFRQLSNYYSTTLSKLIKVSGTHNNNNNNNNNNTTKNNSNIVYQ